MSTTTLPPIIQASKRSHFDSVPVIDFSNAKSQNIRERLELANEIREACMNVGFFYIKNHGVDQNLINEARKNLEEFFALPLEEKQKIIGEGIKGYSPLQSGKNDPYASQGDMHEGFEFGWEDLEVTEAGKTRDDGVMSGDNLWPEQPRDFRKAALVYYHALIEFGLSIFPLFALALGLPETFFDDKTTKPAALMRMLHYPPQKGITDNRVMGIGAHTDWECFTLLWQDEIGGLQVLNQENTWIDAPPIPGTFVLNIGDQFARWTNDIFKSTVHRASNKTGARRYSIPLFFGVDYDVDITPLDICVSSERPSKYPSVTAAEFVKSRFEETYGKTKAHEDPAAGRVVAASA
ncbi:Clavaminate synthase-like protein [Sistotremastrum niveocremeum HHB9708]|uniref:Clavaminate synthase-like protein n=2 Tax=Sistotremastraceae TaxID=3402574 RepID=A0A164V4T2_9AGAM|nr:Clavaminate synthase-like protein [Sistotremastrum niveocremeum HHB9708]KZT35406.1 Clavaminate synthase-like protein [Sistotremastrum suecicum HHB10207 ss-3]